MRNRTSEPALAEKHLGTHPGGTLHELLANQPQVIPPNPEPAYEVDKQPDLRKPVHSILKASTLDPVVALSLPQPILLRRLASNCTRRGHLARKLPAECGVLTLRLPLHHHQSHRHHSWPVWMYLGRRALPSALIARTSTGTFGWPTVWVTKRLRDEQASQALCRNEKCLACFSK